MFCCLMLLTGYLQGRGAIHKPLLQRKPGFTDPVTGQTLQFDACFVKDTEAAALRI
jgi:hypothetical protein